MSQMTKTEKYLHVSVIWVGVGWEGQREWPPFRSSEHICGFRNTSASEVIYACL